VTAPGGEQVSVYEGAGGAPAILALAHAWHQRCLADPDARHPFSHPDLHPQHSERLAAYWGEMLGGPDAYSRELATVADMVRIHSDNGPHPELDAATERCFALALHDAGIPDDQRLHPTLVDWFGLVKPGRQPHLRAARVGARRPHPASGVTTTSSMTLADWLNCSSEDSSGGSNPTVSQQVEVRESAC
jgi:hemoglobin